jgi:hypothetical protein
VGGGVSLPRRLCWFTSGVDEGIHCDPCTHLFGLLNVSQAGFELVAGGGSSPPVFSVYHSMKKLSKG